LRYATGNSSHILLINIREMPVKINSSWKEKLLDFSGIDTLDILRIALLDPYSLGEEILCLRDTLLETAERVLHLPDNLTISSRFSLC
jgi:hypothetical protein